MNEPTRFRKKPVVIEAFQLTPETRRSNESWPHWANEAWQAEVLRPHPGDKEGKHASPLIIDTLEGSMEAMIGDWIIRGIKGELYPCKPDIFAATYEPAPGVPDVQMPLLTVHEASGDYGTNLGVAFGFGTLENKPMSYARTGAAFKAGMPQVDVATVLRRLADDIEAGRFRAWDEQPLMGSEISLAQIQRGE